MRGNPKKRGAPGADVRDVLDAIRRLVRTLRLSARAAEQEVGLSGAQLFVLQALGKSDGLTLGSLAEKTSTDPSSVSVVVARLVDGGLVRRKRDAEDARRLRLSLTAAGRTLLRRAPHAAQERLVDALEGLPATQRRTLGRLLAAVEKRMGIAGEEAPMMFDEEPRRRAR
jgi:MarR family transcriptional regulator, lower aerobic nicotinate degradation pathway regulator